MSDESGPGAANGLDSTEPLRLRFEVDAPPERAFALWTERIASWWPAGHTVAGVAGTEVRFEPRVGGRIAERAPDGAEVEWGSVLAWEPPERVVYRWNVRPDLIHSSEVEVRFAALAGGRTAVELEHRGWERMGAEGALRRRRNRGGWQRIIAAYTNAAV